MFQIAVWGLGFRVQDFGVSNYNVGFRERGILVLVSIVQVWGKDLSIRYLDPWARGLLSTFWPLLEYPNPSTRNPKP